MVFFFTVATVFFFTVALVFFFTVAVFFFEAWFLINHSKGRIAREVFVRRYIPCQLIPHFPPTKVFKPTLRVPACAHS